MLTFHSSSRDFFVSYNIDFSFVTHTLQDKIASIPNSLKQFILCPQTNKADRQSNIYIYLPLLHMHTLGNDTLWPKSNKQEQ